MKPFQHIPLGQAVPDSPHAVLCSLPRLADIIGYEERRPEVVSAMRVGYPRFLTNPLVVRAQQLAAKELGSKGREVRLLSTEHHAKGLARYVGATTSAPKLWRGVWAVEISNEAEPLARAKAFHQHVGASITSRNAEDILFAAGSLGAPHKEHTFSGDAVAKIRANLAEAFGVADPAEVLLTSSGMAAFYAVFEAVRAAQLPRKRTLWLQLGWQYVDTTEVLKKMLGPSERFHFWPDVYDTAGLTAFFQKHGSEIAGVVAEIPTNPLLDAGDLPALHTLCSKHGAVLIGDPTLASPRVVNVLPHCDVVFNSLTKFAGNEGDFLGGVVVINSASPFAKELRGPIAAVVPPHYPRDLARLAAQIDGYLPLIEKANVSAARLAKFLERHPAVKSVHWAGGDKACANFWRVARRSDWFGSIFSFALRGDLSRFYDRVRVVKGPSFGVNFTLICPFMYLAHYDLVNNDKGRAYLNSLGLEPELIRVSVGAENYDEIEAVFAEALA